MKPLRLFFMISEKATEQRVVGSKVSSDGINPSSSSVTGSSAIGVAICCWNSVCKDKLKLLGIAEKSKESHGRAVLASSGS